MMPRPTSGVLAERFAHEEVKPEVKPDAGGTIDFAEIRLRRKCDQQLGSPIERKRPAKRVEGGPHEFALPDPG